MVFTIDPAAASLALSISACRTRSIIIVPPTPGGERDRHPSSGFFNSGAGGVSGFGSRDRQLRLVEPGACRWQAGSGVLNVTLNSVLNVGSGISGLYNTAYRGFGDAGWCRVPGGVGQQLPGRVLAAGTALTKPHHQPRLADVGNYTTLRLGNVGTSTWAQPASRRST